MVVVVFVIVVVLVVVLLVLVIVVVGIVFVVVVVVSLRENIITMRIRLDSDRDIVTCRAFITARKNLDYLAKYVTK